MTKQETVIDYAFLEHCIRDDLNKRAERRMAVLDPIELEITNYPDDKTEMFEATNNPEDKDAGTREISFSKHRGLNAATSWWIHLRSTTASIQAMKCVS